MKPLRSIDALLNDITMYRLMVYGLSIIVGLAFLFSLTDTLTLSAKGMLISLVLLLVACYGMNRLLAYLFNAAHNVESALITTLILFCILPPATTTSRALAVFLAGVIAIVSKYFLAWHRKHIYNPAAAGAVVVALLGLVQATWWIGSTVMLPFTVIFGLLIVRKVRRFRLLASFLLASMVAIIILALDRHQAVGSGIAQAITSSPLVFLGGVMLTEPATMPPRVHQQMVYGLLVGALAASQLRLGSVSITAELSLCLGNLFAYVLSPKYALRLKLKEKHQLSEHVYDYEFTPDRKPTFLAGQYFAWTLPHKHSDSRGNRRTFTIASSPTEETVHLGVKFYEPSSSFKKALKAMEPGDSLTAGQLAGSFVLPRKPKQKLVFIAGGIGITPFRSMIKYVVDKNQQTDIVLFYLIADSSELSYRELWQDAKDHGVQTVPILSAETIPASWTGLTGRLTPEAIEKTVPDYRDRTFYISGPPPMVDAYKSNLQKMGVKRRRIITDAFSGY
jgi:ferredoxin-NADP reductase